MTTNEQFEADLRADLSKFTHSPGGGRAYLWVLAGKVESYLEHTAVEIKRWTAAREQIEADFQAQIGATLPASTLKMLLQVVGGVFYNSENEVKDMHRRLVSVLHDLQAELNALPSV